MYTVAGADFTASLLLSKKVIFLYGNRSEAKYKKRTYFWFNGQ